MLLRLVIKDVVIINHLELDFSAGLSTLTGETGAGKSILLDSLQLALGGRADASLIRSGQKQASVTAIFHPRGLGEQLDALGLVPDDDDELRLRRVLNADGKSRAYINDTPVSVRVLRNLGSELVEIQGQFEQHGLLSPSRHRAVLDSFAQLQPLVSTVAKAYEDWQQSAERLADEQAKLEKDRQEQDYLEHVAKELADASPEAGEHDSLADQRQRLQHAEKLAEYLQEALNILQADVGVERLINQALRVLGRAPDLLQSQITPSLNALEQAADLIGEALGQIETLANEQNGDPYELERVAERLFLLKDLARKHDCDPNELPEVLSQLEAQLGAIEQADETLRRLTQEVASLRQRYDDLADKLSEKRRKAASKLDRAITSELAPLKLERAKVETRIQSLEPAHWGPQGKESLQFLVAMNQGEALGPIGKVASGGELSRFLLALKVVLAGVNPVPTLVFDEVDSGLGGATADAVGERLDRLAEHLQLLTITHSPQVAARARTHYHVAKSSKKGKTETQVRHLSDDERIEEIARMLSGSTITAEARAAAQALLDRANS